MSKEENIGLGVLGAILGAVVGSIAWIVLSQLGFIAGIAGLAIIAASLKGYELLGGRLSKLGVIICVVISLLMICLAEYFSLGLTLVRVFNENGHSFSEAMDYFPTFLDDSELKLAIVADLVIGYIFAVIAGGTFVIKAFKKASKNNEQ